MEIEAIRNKKKVTGKDGKEMDFLPYTYLMSESVDMWTQSHDGGRRFEAMTTNILDCFNGVSKGARGLPIATMIEFTWSKLVEYFHDWHKEITHDLLEGQKWSTYAFSTWLENRFSCKEDMQSKNNCNLLISRPPKKKKEKIECCTNLTKVLIFFFSLE